MNLNVVGAVMAVDMTSFHVLFDGCFVRKDDAQALICLFAVVARRLLEGRTGHPSKMSSF